MRSCTILLEARYNLDTGKESELGPAEHAHAQVKGGKGKGGALKKRNTIKYFVAKWDVEAKRA